MNDLNTFLTAKSGGVANLQSERGQVGSIVWFAEGMLKRAPIFFHGTWEGSELTTGRWEVEFTPPR